MLLKRYLVSDLCFFILVLSREIKPREMSFVKSFIWRNETLFI